MPLFPSLALLAAMLLPAIATAVPAEGPEAVPAGAASALPLSAFLDPGDFGSLEISPDGAYYAATMPMEDRTLLVVLRRADMKRTAVVILEEKAHVSSFEWVNPRQVVYTVSTQSGRLEAPVLNPFLYIADAEGGNGRPVDKRMSMSLVDGLRGEDDVILVTGLRGIGRYDLKTGRFTAARVRSPLHTATTFLDTAGEVRMVSGYFSGELKPRLYLRDGKGKWRHVNIENESGETVYVAGFSADNRSAYLMVEQEVGTDTFVRLDLETLERTPVLRNERVDASHMLTSPLTGAVIGVVYLDGKPRIEYVDPEDFHARELQKLARAFPHAYVRPTSYTSDGKLGVYFVSSDVNSGEYYLVDHASGKAHFIAADSEGLDPALMSPMTPFRFKARDGLELEGFLTRPRTWPEGKPGPMVVVPHGGPKGLYDRWGFDSEVQILASRGYAVLQVNFRGSGNYGRQFREAGNGQWGRKMQDDLTDATQWAIAQGHAESGRICLYGASYGAYAAMMGLAREPGLYACGIGNVGVYDLKRMYHEDTVGRRDARAYWDEALGQSDLASISPTNLARQIRAPVLLGAGEDDTTAPPHHTEAMERALALARVPVESVIYPNEAHGYYDADNRADWAKRVLSLLDRTIGPARAASASPES
jgi:dienelactone hydrolase